MPDACPAIPAWQRGIRRLRLIFETWYPWDQRKVAGKIRPLKIRQLDESDIEWCLKLYNRNTRHGIPESGLPQYQEYLESNDHLILIAEEDGCRVGTFGIHLSDENTGYVSYLLVDPGAHRSGVGTTLILIATALLPTLDDEKYLMLTALDGARAFYRSLSFTCIHTEMHHGCPLYHLVLGPMPILLIKDCIEMLSVTGVNIRDLPTRIPRGACPLPTGVTNAGGLLH